MTEALRLRLQAEAAMWRQRGDTHLRLLLEEAIAALAQPPAPTAQPLPPFRVSEILIDAGYNFSTPEAIADFINGLRHGEAAHGITAAPAAQKGEKL